MNPKDPGLAQTKPLVRHPRRAAKSQKHLVVSSEFGAFVGLATLVEGRAVAMTRVRKANPEPSDGELLAAMRGAPLALDGPEIQRLTILDAVLAAPYLQKQGDL